MNVWGPQSRSFCKACGNDVFCDFWVLLVHTDFVYSFNWVCVCVCVSLCVCVVLCCVCVCVCVCACVYACTHMYMIICVCAYVRFFFVCVYTHLCRLLYDCMFLWETFSTEALAKTHQMFKISLFIRTKHTFCVFGSCFRTLAVILIKTHTQKTNKHRRGGGKENKLKSPLVHSKSSLGSHLRTQML